jgi:drug/metabolite transporter (DMT)-like permease
MTRISPSLIAAALFSVLSMSLVPLLVRTTQADEFVIGIVRIVVTLLFLTPIILHRPGLRGLTRKQWALLVLIGVIFGVHWLTYFISIKYSGASISALALCTFGIHLLIMNCLFNRQRLQAGEWMAVLTCFVGCVFVAPSFDLTDQTTQGLLIGIFSGMVYATLPLIHQRLRTVPTLVRAWGQFTFASFIFVPLLPWAEWSHLTYSDWWRLVALGVICTLIGHSLWVKVSTELPAVMTSVIYYLYVPIAMVASFWLLDEKIDAPMIFGATLIIGGNVAVALMAWQRQRRFFSQRPQSEAN